MKNARKHILINPAFQLRFAILITLTVVTISMIFPIFFFGLFDVANSHPSLQGNPAIRSAIAAAKKDFLMLTLGIQALLIVGTFILAIFHSHRIVGPLYKLRISMVALRQGLLDRHIQFRKGDNFTDLAAEFNAMTDSIFGRKRKDMEAIQSVLPKLDRLQQNLQGQDQAIVIEVVNVLRELSHDKKHA